MKHRKTWVGIGIGLLLWLAAGWGAISSPRHAAEMAELRFWIWLPKGLLGWPLLAATMGGVLLAGSGWWAWKLHRNTTTPDALAVPDTASAFSIDPWTDTDAAYNDPGLPLADLVTLLWNTARTLEAQGRLRAAREMYREAHELARRVPEWGGRKDEIALAERKVALRMRLARDNPTARRNDHS